MAVKVIATLDAYKQPDNIHEKIWRYMDFSKFLYLLENSSLYFSRADRFEDQLEGRHSNYDLDLRKKAIREQDENLLLDETIKGYNKSFERLKAKMFISCWFMGEYQSATMWKLYGVNKESVAIQTTYDKFQKTINDIDKNVEVSVVEYINYENHDKPMVGAFHPFFFKRKGYKEENEIRAVIMKLDSMEEYGIDFNVGLEALIENIYVSPFAGKWFYKLVKDILKRYGYENIPVIYTDFD